MFSLLAMVALATTASAASSKSSKTGPSSSSFKAFQTCLSQHGVKSKFGGFGHFSGGFGGPPQNAAGGSAPSSGSFPRPGAGGFANSKSAKAFAVCRSKLPNAGRFGAGAFKPTPAQQQALTTYENCMSAHGVKIAANASFQTIRALAQADPTAAQACQSDLQGVFPRRGGGSGPLTPGSSSTTS